MGAPAVLGIEKDAITWQLAHAALSRLARQRATADAEEGRWLLAARRAAAHVHLGFGSFNEYVERLFGYQSRSTQEKLRVAGALEELPALERTLREGDLNWSAARELTRVAVRETEQQWIEFARGKTLRQLEELVAGKRPGDAPAAPPDLSVQRHVLRFAITAETFALFRDAQRELRSRSGTALDDDSILLEMARCVLGGPRDEGRASYQVVLSVCPECARGRQHTDGALVPVGPEILAMAGCDGQHVGSVDEPWPQPANDSHPHPDPPREQRAEHPSPAVSDSAHLEHSNPAVSNSAHVEHSNPAVSDSAHLEHSRRAISDSTYVEDDPARTREQRASATAAMSDTHGDARGPDAPVQRNARVGARAHQNIPPAVRRAVLLRDQRRCQVPGCRNTRFLDVHHLELRSEGGQCSMANLTCLCGAHHRASHRGRLRIDRDRAGTLRVRHADGSEYGCVAQPQVLETRTKVFSALRQLGFREGEVRAVFRQLEGESSLREAAFDRLLRAALALLPRAGCRVR